MTVNSGPVLICEVGDAAAAAVESFGSTIDRGEGGEVGAVEVLSYEIEECRDGESYRVGLLAAVEDDADEVPTEEEPERRAVGRSWAKTLSGRDRFGGEADPALRTAKNSDSGTTSSVCSASTAAADEAGGNKMVRHACRL